jgi:tetratricopeptide (TPR) repeat protein
MLRRIPPKNMEVPRALPVGSMFLSIRYLEIDDSLFQCYGVVSMMRRELKYALYMVPVIWSLLKDLTWEELSMEEIRTNYLFGKAHAYDRAHLFEKGVGVYHDLIREDSNNIPVYLNLGGLYYRRGMFEKAIPYYERVIRRNPKHYHAHYWLAMCFFQLRRYHAAIHTLEEVIEFLPTFKDALNLMGECYEEIGEGAKAERCYLKAISVDPKGIIIHGTVRAQMKQEKVEERVKH